MNKIYIYNGAEYTEDQVTQAATNLGLSFDEYISKYGLTLKKEKVGKPVATVAGAPVDKSLAPESLELTLTDTTSVSPEIEIPETVQTGTVADTVALTEEEQEQSKNIVSTITGRAVRGVSQVGAQLMTIPENLLYTGMALHNPDMTREEKLALKDAIKGSMDIASPYSASDFERVSKSVEPLIKKYDDKDIYTAIDNGNYGDALEMAVGGAVESLPSLVAARLGPVGIFLFGASVMSGKFDEELRANPDQTLSALGSNSLLTGLNEAAGELLTRKLLFATKIIKATGAAGAAKEFLNKGLNTIISKYGVKPAGEGFSEALTEVGNVIIDKLTLGKDITWSELRNRLVEAFTVGAITGAGVNTIQDAYTQPMDRNMAETILMPSQTQFELRNRAENMSRLAYELQRSQDPGEQQAYIDMMTEEELAIVDIKNRNKFELNTLEGSMMNKYVNNRDEIYKLDEANKKEGISFEVKKRNQERIASLNKMNDNILEMSVDRRYEKMLSSVQREARDMSIDVKEFKTNEEFQNYIEQKTGKRPGTGVEGTFYRDSGEIVINKQAAIESRNVNVAAHELLHGVLTKTIKDGEQNAEALANSMFEQIKNIPAEEFQDTEYYQRLMTYMSRINYGRSKVNEEVAVLYGDALANGDVNPDEDILTEMGDMIRRSWYSLGFRRTFNKPKDVLNFLKDYNRSIQKGYVDRSIRRIAREGMRGRIFSESDAVNQDVGEMLSISKADLVAENKKILEQAGGAANLTPEQKAQIQDNVDKINNITEAQQPKVPEGVSKDAVKRSTETQKVYEELGASPEALLKIADINAPFINQVANKLYKNYPGFKESGYTREDFISDLKVGTIERPSNSLLALLRSYKPETGKALSQYIMANLENRGKGLLQQMVGEQVTVGAGDITEVLDYGTDQELLDTPFRAQRRIASLGLKRSILDKVNKLVQEKITDKLPIYYGPFFKNRLQYEFRTTFTDIIFKSWPVDNNPKGTMRWTEYVIKNARGIYETLTDEKVKKSTRSDLREILYDGKQKRPFEEVKDDLIEYYVAPRKIGKLVGPKNNRRYADMTPEERAKAPVSSPRKTQHRTQLARQIADALGFEAAADILQTDSQVAGQFKINQRKAMETAGMARSSFNENDIVENAVRFITDNIRDIDFDALDSNQKKLTRNFSRAASKLLRDSKFKDMSILDINNFFIKEFGLDYVSAANIVTTQYNLLMYVDETEAMDRDELKRLYDEAYYTVKLAIVKDDTPEDTFNRFNDFEAEQLGHKENNDEFYALTKKQAIKGFTDWGIPLPKNYKKMTAAELLDYQLNMPAEEMSKYLKIEKEQRDELDLKFNEILEQTKGVDKETILSAAQASQIAKKFRFSLPPILHPKANDFEGILYRFLASGKVGEEQYKFFRKTLLNTFAEGINASDRFKNGLLKRHKDLIKTLNVYKNNSRLKRSNAVKKYFQEELPGTVVTRENAVRLYLWRKNGTLTIPGDIGKDGKPIGDKATITDITVQQLDDIMYEMNQPQNKELKAYATQMGGSTHNVGPDGNRMLYMKFMPSWLGGTIGTDLLDYANGTKRKEFLQQWSDNVDRIFNEDNYNKIRAIYGVKTERALKRIIKRMKSGRNRPVTEDVISNRIIDYLNGSVGTIMFFNMKSAALQTISAINYINWSDNNIVAAGKAFANQKQFWSDFMMILNSDFLKARRGGLKIDISADELAQSAADKNKFWRLFSKMGKYGFLPTQLIDSVAISFGGASFYRNRLKTYLKQGMSESDANKQAFIDLQEISEDSQQSSRPDRVSELQASTLAGRLVFSFANTSMQYIRKMNKAYLDIINNRGNQVENISRIAYYGVVQSILFNSLQNAVNMLDFDDEDEEHMDNIKRAWNGVLQGHLRGWGMGGAVIAALLEIQKEIETQEQSGRSDTGKLIIAGSSISPPIQAKLRKIVRAYNMQNVYGDVIKKSNKMGWKMDLDNPKFRIYANYIEATGNIPVANLLSKTENYARLLDDDIENIDRLLLSIGWDQYTLDLVERQKPKKKGSKRTSKRTSKR